MSGLRAFCVAALLCSACTSVSEEPDFVGGADAGPDDNNPAAGCTSNGNDLVYVVDTDFNLLSFDPRKLGTSDPFTSIGTLNCPTEPIVIPGLGEIPSGATPFSMSVDRQGTAWVLYNSGELFKVSVDNASCVASTFRGQSGFETFGMGFVSDSPGSASETLFVAGGNGLGGGDLGQLKTDTLMVSSVGALPAAENAPELTGTGAAELYGYFPGTSQSFVARLNKQSSSAEQTWPVQPLADGIRAWAFAHWGGKFYMFISTEGAGVSSQVRVLDTTTGEDSIVVPNSPYIVVGAGVSTCAPVVVE